MYVGDDRVTTGEAVHQIKSGMVLEYLHRAPNILVTKERHVYTGNVAWSNVNTVGLINEVNQRRIRLVLGWVTVVGWVNPI